MKDKEIEVFEKKFGYKFMVILVVIDVLVVFVNKDNLIKGMSIEQVDVVFFFICMCGGNKDFKIWSDLGLIGDWGKCDIQLYGCNLVFGIYGYFKDEVLCKGDFKSIVNEQLGFVLVV